MVKIMHLHCPVFYHFAELRNVRSLTKQLSRHVITKPLGEYFETYFTKFAFVQISLLN